MAKLKVSKCNLKYLEDLRKSEESVTQRLHKLIEEHRRLKGG